MSFGVYTPNARLIWSLTQSGAGTKLTATGNSSAGGAPQLDLRDVTDVILMTSVTTVAGTTPSLQVQLDVFDAEGNLYPAVIKLATAMTAAGVATASGGLHSGLVLPQYGQITWTITGTTPSFTGTEISVFGR